VSFSTVNPATGETIQAYSYAEGSRIEQTLQQLHSAQVTWSKRPLEQRKNFLTQLARELRKQQEPLARLMTQEMGKVILESRAEVEKCAATAEYYSKKAEEWLAGEIVHDGNFKARVEKEAMGVVLAIMPWNFPCWQVIRFAVPALLGGNTGLLKHAEITAGTSAQLSRIFNEAAKNANIPEPIFAELRLSHEQVANVIADPRISAVTFTGSVRGGAQVAEVAGKNLKKSVMELGGSDAYLVLHDADVQSAAKACAQGRLQNAGQSCVAAKRFFVHQSIAEKWKQEMAQIFSNLKVGDPCLDATQMGPLAHKKFQTQLQSQVEKSQGRIMVGGKISPVSPKASAFYPPTLLDMPKTSSPWPLWTEEFFGPVACIWTFADEKEAIAQANHSIFGLGGAVFSSDLKRAAEVAKELRCGFVAINDMVKSDPKVPFGGLKSSGYGRELSHYGLMEFVNVKTITGV
jgi:succinate-semialdehyde dehydrogenase/glutarate-semialdehyde dehydrogenase